MTYRLESRRAPDGTTLAFEGQLDDAAVAELATRVAASTGRVRVVLRAGTEVAPECVARLARLGAELHAESPFLARWLAEEQP